MADNENLKSRKWLLTINNPEKYEYTHDFIKSALAKLTSVTYWCMSDEIGFEGTYHTHLFIYAPNAIKAKTLHNSLEKMHRDLAKGTCQQNRDYVYKEGKWLNSDKADTNLRDTHEEWGELPIEHQGKRNDIDDLYCMIKDGLTNYEIFECNPQYLLHVDKIDKIRQVVKDEQFGNTWRTLDITYIWGLTGTGKTRGVIEKHGYRNVFRVTDYIHPFDGYKGQDVVVFEEFRSSALFENMLKWLDGHPVELPARYTNKTACFSTVYIISNRDLREQYPNIQQEFPRDWDAFLRRINHVEVYTGKSVERFTTEEYLRDNWPFFVDNSPFESEE